MKVFLFAPACVAALFVIASAGCVRGTGQGANSPAQESEKEETTSGEGIDWSTVTPELLWEGVSTLYREQGPGQALSFLEQGINAQVVTDLEADQVRASLLNELGRLDEAFLALARYKLDVDHPDLLSLRAQILWSMARYDEARRDYETLLTAAGDDPSPSLLAALARLYDDLGEWQESGRMRERLYALAPNDPSTFQLRLYRAILAEGVDEIKQVALDWSDWLPDSLPKDALSILADAYVALLEGKAPDAAGEIREYISEQGFNSDIASLLLQLDAESDDFEAFETDLRSLFDYLDAVQWLEAPEGIWPQPAEQPLGVAQMLDWASALELGRGDSGKARLLAERARSLDPYDFVAVLQSAAVEICMQDTSAFWGLLEEASDLAPPSDVRVRLRMLQFAPLARPGSEIPWDPEVVAQELDTVLNHRLAEFPRSALFRAAHAETLAFAGDLETALRESEEACSLPGATRETHLRRAYYLARLGRADDAWEVVKNHLPPDAPHLTWASALLQEAAVRSDQDLAVFATKVRTYLDPTGLHPEFFAPPATDSSH
jgi:hypothetical protein